MIRKLLLPLVFVCLFAPGVLAGGMSNPGEEPPPPPPPTGQSATIDPLVLVNLFNSVVSIF